MSNISSINAVGVRSVLMNMTLAVVALAINAAAAATVKTTGAINYTIGGLMYTKAALAAQSIAVTHDAFGKPVAAGFPAYVQPAGSRVIYVLSVNKAGAIAVSQGAYAGQRLADKSNKGLVLDGTGDVPLEPDGYTAFGAIVVTTSGAATFTAGTTALDAANVAATFHNVSILPESL